MPLGTGQRRIGYTKYRRFSGQTDAGQMIEWKATVQRGQRTALSQHPGVSRCPAAKKRRGGRAVPAYSRVARALSGGIVIEQIPTGTGVRRRKSITIPDDPGLV